jgi:hypothetical protein
MNPPTIHVSAQPREKSAPDFVRNRNAPPVTAISSHAKNRPETSSTKLVPHRD